MNKFQRDLNIYKEKLNSNKEEQIKLSKEKEEKDLKIVDLELRNYEIDNILSEYSLIKKRYKKNESKMKKIKFNSTLSMFLISFFELFILTISLLSGIFYVAYDKINSLLVSQNVITKNLTLEEIVEVISELKMEKKNNLANKEELLNSIADIDFKIKLLTHKVEKLYADYKVLLDTYQNSLSEIDPKISDEELENILNKEYTDNFPQMVKKIFRKFV